MKRRQCRLSGPRASPRRIPTVRLQGYDTLTGSWESTSLPEGTLSPVIKRRYKVGQATMNNPTVLKQRSISGFNIVASTPPEDFAAFL